MSGFATEVSELFAARNLVCDAAEEGRTELVRLQASADDLLGHGWRGAAATAFAEGWSQWLEGAELVLEGLHETSQALGATAADYASAESASVGSARSV